MHDLEVLQSLQLPAYLVEPAPVDGWRLLRASRDDVPLQRVPELDEASTAWPLRPRPIPREPSLAARVAAGRGAPSANAYPYAWRTTADCWRPRLERAASGLACLGAQYHLRGWDVGAAFPGPLSGPLAEDALSDSESEDDADDRPLPTFADCRAVFDAPDAAPDDAPRDSPRDGEPPSPPKSPRSAASSPRDAAAAAGDAAPREPGDAAAAPDVDAIISDVPRDVARLELCREESERRATAARLLPERKRLIANAIRCPVLRARVDPGDF